MGTASDKPAGLIMEFFAVLVLLVMVAVFAALLLTKYSPDLILLSGLCILVVVGNGFFPAKIAFSGMTNEGVLTIAALFIVAGGIRETGSVYFLVSSVLGLPKTVTGAQIRLMLPVTALSGFINNTPLVAVMLPMVVDWSRKINIPPSRLLIPLSYGAILGGMTTLIGTSTNLLVYGLLAQQPEQVTMTFFEITKIGVPCAAVGVVYLAFASRYLLPTRSPTRESLEDVRQYTLEMVVEEGSAIIGRSIEDAGLRHLPGLYLIEIERNGEILPAVSPREKLLGSDRLIFAGVVDSVIDLQKLPGLKPAPDQTFKLKGSGDRILIEAVVSHQAAFVGKSIREAQFRTNFNAVVIAVSRDGERIKKKIGDIVLQAGDMLLIEAHPNFISRHRGTRDFYLLSQVQNYTPPRHDKAWVALLIFGLMLALVYTNILSMFQASLTAAGVMVATKCLTITSARRSIDYRVLLTIIAALGLGMAVKSSGLADIIITTVLQFSGEGILISIISLYVATLVLSELMTNSAAAGIMISIAFALAEQLGIDNFLPFAITVMIASSAAFATPFGYQTNMMIYGPGGYRFQDYLKIGIPLDIIVGAVAVPLIYYFYF